MAFILDDQDPSITSESAPFIQPVDYDSDVELFQVPLKRENSPLKIPSHDPVSKAALRYALKPSSPPGPSEESLSTTTHSQPNIASRDTSPHNKAGSSPPSSLSNDEQQHQQSHASSQKKNKILQATQLHLTKGKARTVLTNRPKKLVLSLQANIYQPALNADDVDTEDEQYSDRIHKWLEQCQVGRADATKSRQESQELCSIINGRAILAGPHLLHPFLGPALFSPPPPPAAEPKVYAINIHGTLAHHTLATTPEHQHNPREINMKSRGDERLGDQDMSDDRNSSRQATSDSAYDRAREMEIWLSEASSSSSQPNVLLKGKAHWFIDANLTEESHFRLAQVARQSAEGFDCLKRHHLEAAGNYLGRRGKMNLQDTCGEGLLGNTGNYTWGPGGAFTVGGKEDRDSTTRHRQMHTREVEEQQQRRVVEAQTAAELAELYRALAVVHTVFGEEIKAEREGLHVQGGQGQGSVVADTMAEKERGRGRHRERYGGARERERGGEQEYRDETGVVRRRSMGSKIGSLRGRRRRRVGS